MSFEPERAAISLCAPALAGPTSGGTLFNGELLAALVRSGANARWIGLQAAQRVEHGRDWVLVDSLFLDAVARLRAQVASGRLLLLLHYLPSLVRLGRAVTAAELEHDEHRALRAADGYIVTSAFMRDQLAVLELDARSVTVVEPGTDVLPAPHTAHAGMRVVMLANLVEGKQVLPFLHSLTEMLREDDALRLEVIGSLQHDVAYAQQCAALIARSPLLAARVTLCGALPHARALERLRAASVLVSASRMESYGMALAEARAAGVPIIACRGGNTAALVGPESGGALCEDEAAVARVLIDWTRDPAQLAAQQQRARAAIRARSWDAAARELLLGLERMAQHG